MPMPPPAPNTSAGNNNPQSLFTPPRGGDITLRSSDGVDFLVHSTTLKFASSIFNAMIATTPVTTMELTETASDVSNLLGFIYPNKLPLTINPDMLPGCLQAVRKYDVEGAIEIIDQLVALDTLPPKFLSSDPVRAYQLAMRFNLVKTRAAAMPLVMTSPVDFCNLDKASEFVQKYSSPGLVYLMNIQAMRAKVLSDVLFRFDRAPIQPLESDPDMYWYLSCTGCRNRTKELFKKVTPSWVLGWVRLIYEALLTSSEPLAKSNHLFRSTSLKCFEKQPSVCQSCLRDFAESSSQGPRFDAWAQAIKDVLEAQLSKLESVNAL
ncbi:hypothetical protein RSAG8_03065, partial [Rhizoctonia solani AG-8 WAC10335]